MTERRTPPKRRGATPDRQCQCQHTKHTTDTETVGSAPAHLGGSFDDAGYGSGHGAFGFTQVIVA